MEGVGGGFGGGSGGADGGEVRGCGVGGGGVGLGAEEEDAVAGEAGFVGGEEGRWEVGGLGDEAFGARVAELEGQLVGGVERVGGRDDATGPEGAEGEDGGLSVVRMSVVSINDE